MVESNWVVFVVALLVGVGVAYWVFVRGTQPARPRRRPDVLDEGAAPARRNQALIDAEPAASLSTAPHIDPPALGATMAGIGEVIAVAAQEEIERAVATGAAPLSALPPAEAPPVDAAPADDLRRIKGLGPKMATLLTSLGVTTFAQIAAWTDADLDALDAKLGAFAGRPRRDKWVEQAALLASGRKEDFEAAFGKL